ncbi:MAG: NOL1/NOP2/sun family putative RNA methylase [Lachnospiraceae bacterium]|jgi:NOL1/NOP2/sun family putative RNA methylase|nr:NOL1/NOP2/sun family putative RNA methylase [Lachnospiraceae bacterium]
MNFELQLPEKFLENMKKLLGEEYQAWMDSFQEESFRGLRVNTSKIDVEEFEKISPFPLEKIPWIRNGFYLSPKISASRHPYYAAGLYYLQEPSAMTPAAYLPIEEGDRVLDLCAAPGGKATELAARLKGTGLLVANDISNSRAKGLLKNLELFGAANILVTSETPQRLVSYFQGFFDKILVDAPCSGEGMFRRDPSMKKDWLEHGPSHYAPIQREIIEQASKLLKPGGQLLYSTCTFSPEENEGTIAWLLENERAFQVVSLSDYEGFSRGRPELIEELESRKLTKEHKEQIKKCVRIYPHRMNGEGHFLALLQKEKKYSEESEISRAKARKPEICQEWEDFQRLILLPIEEMSLCLYDKKLYSLPKALWDRNIRGLRFLRTGLYLGEVGKKRFEPSQALAMVLKKEECSAVIDFSSKDQRVLRYLKGETLEVDDLTGEAPSSGWRLICVDRQPLGWAKLVNGSLRNKYYAGWRL